MAGKIVTFEGCDGCGKHTQSVLFHQYLLDQGIEAELYSFPSHGSYSAKPVEMYLQGRLGDNLSALSIGMLYAFDRVNTIKDNEIEKKLENGTWIIFDRYTESNVIYMAAKCKFNNSEDADELAEKLFHLEHEVLGLPYPNETVYLNLSREINMNMLNDRNTVKDIHEQNDAFLNECARIGLDIADKCENFIIECDNEDKSGVRDKDDIHNEIVEKLRPLIEEYLKEN